jgi:thymidylate kinase
MKPIRISIIGIDGSGKSTTTLRAIQSLSHQFPMCKTGRNPFSVWKGRMAPCLPKTATFFETLFKRVDATKKRMWIGLTRILFVFFQGWLEPHMVERYNPRIVMATRCMIIDSAIYSDFYYPRMSQRLTIGGKLKFAQRACRLPFRDLYFFLSTPVPMALGRIYKRISDEHPEITYGRDYWLHLHENEETLQRLDKKFRETLQAARVMNPFKVVEIDTAKHTEEEVAQLITDYSMAFCEENSFEEWKRI